MKEIFGIKKVDRQGKTKTFWTRIGVAHEVGDGSLNCVLDYLPIGENITLNIRDQEKATFGRDQLHER